ncbi:MAG: glucosaminidase domain-containing protein [Chitinophagales bacterium]
MQALFFNTFVLWCLLSTQELFAHNLIWIDPISNEAAQQYVLDYKDIAVRDMHRTGIPASIKLAQAMFESNFGRSDLAIRGNNHFGIKCYKVWKGEKLYYDDDKPNECFRQYTWVDDSYKDHSRIITSKKRYEFLFELASIDYEGWANGLQKAGYASDPQYAQKLIWMIEKHDLHQYDFEEDPFSDDTSIIAANTDEILDEEEDITTTRQPDLPLAYTKKFGDIQKTVPQKLQIYQTNYHQLFSPSAPAMPKAHLLNSSFPLISIPSMVRVDDIQEQENIEEQTYIISSTDKRIPINLTTLPYQSYNEKVIVYKEKTFSSLSFKKRTLPSITPHIEKEILSAPPQLQTSTSIVNITTTSISNKKPSISTKKRLLPTYHFTLKMEEETVLEPIVAPFSAKAVEVTLANPSATKESDAVLISPIEVVYLNKLKMVQYEKTVSLKEIAQSYQITLVDLMAYNDVTDSTLVFSSQIPIFLEAKKSKSANNSEKEHIVEEGETMWEIAQQYGIQLEELLARNYLKQNEEPLTGEILLLRSQAPYPPKIKREKPKANVSEELMEATLKEIKKNQILN